MGKNLIATIVKKRIRIGGGSKKGRQHVVHEQKYRRQAMRTAKNKEKAWTEHLSKHPNDLQAKEQITKARKLV